MLSLTKIDYTPPDAMQAAERDAANDRRVTLRRNLDDAHPESARVDHSRDDR